MTTHQRQDERAFHHRPGAGAGQGSGTGGLKRARLPPLLGAEGGRAAPAGSGRLVESGHDTALCGGQRNR